MSITTIIQAWKDEAYLQSLSEAEAALVPANPSGMLELTDEELALVAGGKKRKRKKKKKSSRSSRSSRSRSRST
jgi:mersacidin/lichenicidin family type 2 lantibiotic